MEAPPAKNILFIVVLLSTFALLVSTMPSEFVEGSNPQYRKADVPSYFEAIDVEQFANTYVITPDSDYYIENWGKTQFGHDMQFHANRPPTFSDYYLYNEHCFPFLFFYRWGAHKMEWIVHDTITTRGTTLYSDEIESDMENGTARYVVKCNHFQMNCWVGYNTSLYNSVEDAWDNNGLSLMFAIEWDEKGTGINAWNLIGLLLFFQLPNIHWTLNALIAIPLWLMIAYLIFAFVMAVIKSLPLT